MNVDKFLQRLPLRPDSDCWPWLGKKDKDGYGKFGSGYAHRIAFTLFKGEIPPRMDIDHLCWNRDCCNPAHLEPLPLKINRARQRSAIRPECSHGHPLTEQNTYVRKNGDGKRQCRACNLLAAKRYRARKKEKRK